MVTRRRVARLEYLAEQASHCKVDILHSEEWIRIRTAIVEALEPYPQARLAVAEALRKLDEGETQ